MKTNYLSISFLKAWRTLLAKHYCFRLTSGVTFLFTANYSVSVSQFRQGLTEKIHKTLCCIICTLHLLLLPFEKCGTTHS